MVPVNEYTEINPYVKERIVINISLDSMSATAVFNLSEEELDLKNRSNLVRETASNLRDKGIVFGVKRDIFQNKIDSGRLYVIAEGVYPEDGIDSVIKMFELKEIKPEAIENEKINYYNVSLIHTVDADTWLGERLEAKEGIDGTNVMGETVKAKRGITFPLYYDKETVYEVKDDYKTVLYSRVYGAVYYKDKYIALMNPLIIKRDVDFQTGNIIFNGCVIINGTICDGFYVEAENDIEVNGELGLGNIKGIVSKKGSIFVKGGILSKGGTRLEAAKNIYVKFIENVSVNCGEEAHIGFYCSNCTINAKEVIVNFHNGKIIGSNIKALTRVVSPIIGSEIGKRTVIEVACFNKKQINTEVDALTNKIDELKSEYEQVKQRIHNYSIKTNLTAIQDKILNDSKERIAAVRNELKTLTRSMESYKSYLKTRGDGEIYISKIIYPNTSIIMKNKSLEVSVLSYSMTFVSQGGKIIQL